MWLRRHMTHIQKIFIPVKKWRQWTSSKDSDDLLGKNVQLLEASYKKAIYISYKISTVGYS